MNDISIKIILKINICKIFFKSYFAWKLLCLDNNKTIDRKDIDDNDGFFWQLP